MARPATTGSNWERNSEPGRRRYASIMHDVVIVGGSLAGAATAIHLANRGRRVLILEQDAFPRRKVCGEGLLPMGTRELARLGVLQAVAANGEALRKIRFEAGGQAVEAPFSATETGLGVRRTVLDGVLLARAEEAGVDVLRATATRLVVRDRRVTAIETTNGQLHKARAFVGADGLHSRIRRLAGLEAAHVGGRYGAAVHGHLPGLERDIVRVHFLGGHEVYVTPVGGDAANFVVLLSRSKLRAMSPRPVEALQEFLERLPVLRGLKLEELPLVGGPFPRSAIRAWRGNLALAGDAAGFFDGITGEGMGAALAGARACAAALDDSLDSRSLAPLREYDRFHRALVRNSDWLARITLALGARSTVAETVIRNLSRRPELFARLVAINGGEASLAALRPRDLLTMVAGR